MKMKTLALLLVLGTAAFAQQRMALTNIKDTAGNPIQGATLVMTSAQDTNYRKEVKSDKKGNGSFYRFPPADYTITINKEGYLERKIEFRTSPEKTREKFETTLFREDEGVANPENSILVTGIVSDTKGAPLAGVKLVATIEGTPFKSETTTDASGNYELQGLKNNTLKILGSLNEYRDQINLVKVRERNVELFNTDDFVMQTLDEAYAALGMERPKEEEVTPEQEAIEIYNLAVEPYQQGKFSEAEDIAKRALAKDPKQSKAMKLIVFSNLKTEDWEDVYKYGEMYLKEEPEDLNIKKAVLNASQFLGMKDKVASIKNELKAAGEISKDSLWNDAITHLNNNDDDNAMKVIKEILEMDPKDARAYFEIGKMKVREGEFDDAVKNLKIYLKHAPSNHPYIAEAKELIVTLSE